MKIWTLACTAAWLVSGQAAALSNGLARTPPMGWNSWNAFHSRISGALIEQIAYAMATSRTGMKAAGYRYVNIDDGWASGRAADGTIIADPELFPMGIAAVVAYVHACGLKLGIYTDLGTLTCLNRPGSYGYEGQDARTYAAWGVDYVKADWCGADGLSPWYQYKVFGQALADSGRPMVFSICDWGVGDPWEWAPTIGNLWRTTGDIQNCWSCAQERGMGGGVTAILDQQLSLARHAGPGAWNDPDMLEVGNGVLTADEERAHFSLWCILAAPLIASNDLRSMTPDTKNTLTNPEAIAVDQDPRGVQGSLVRDWGDGLQVWAKPLNTPGSSAVALLNRGETESDIAVNWGDLGLAKGSARVRDLWTHLERGTFAGGYRARVRPHAVVLLKIVGSPLKP